MRLKKNKLAVLSIVIACTTAGRPQDIRLPATKSATEAQSELMGSMDDMRAAMASVRTSGSPDIDFARLMLIHHQAAIDMARVELTNGADPQLRRMAQEIVTDQQSEIELMRLWLKQHEAASGK